MNQNISQQFAERLRALRMENGLTQKQLAQDSGVPLSFIAAVERGRASRGVAYACKLADYFCVTLENLLRGR